MQTLLSATQYRKSNSHEAKVQQNKVTVTAVMSSRNRSPQTNSQSTRSESSSQILVENDVAAAIATKTTGKPKVLSDSALELTVKS